MLVLLQQNNNQGAAENLTLYSGCMGIHVRKGQAAWLIWPGWPTWSGVQLQLSQLNPSLPLTRAITHCIIHWESACKL
jgi:hypothetical protein